MPEGLCLKLQSSAKQAHLPRLIPRRCLVGPDLKSKLTNVKATEGYLDPQGAMMVNANENLTASRPRLVSCMTLLHW